MTTENILGSSHTDGSLDLLGVAAFLSLVTTHHNSIYLLDQDGKLLVKSGIVSPFSTKMATAALQSRHSEMCRFDLSHFKSHELGARLTRMHLALALLRRQFAEKTAENWK